MKCPSCDFRGKYKQVQDHFRHRHTDYESSFPGTIRTRTYGILRYEKNKEFKEALKAAKKVK